MKWFCNLKIAVKLVTSFIIVALIAGVVGFVGIVNIRTIDDNDTMLYTNMTVPIAYSAEMAKLFQRARVNTRDMVLENDIQEINGKYDRILQIADELNVLSDQFEKTIISDEVRKEFEAFLGTRAAFRFHLDELVTLARENRDEEAYMLLKGELKIAGDLEKEAIDTLVQMKVENAKQKVEMNRSIANKAVIMMTSFIVGGMVIAIAMGLCIARMISNPIKELVEEAKKIANGELDININNTSKDEVGILAKAFRQMAENINNAMTDISTASEQVACGSKQVSDSSVDLSQGATEQASSIEELTAAIEEISSQTEANV